MDNNFSYSLEILPYFNNENTDYQYYEMIDYINNRHHNLNNFEKTQIEIKINTLSNDKSKRWIILSL